MTRRLGRRSAIPVVVVAGLLAGCATASVSSRPPKSGSPSTRPAPSPSTPTPAPTAPSPAPPAPISWSSCPATPDVECGTVEVPVDYAKPNGATLAIAVTRARALDQPAKGTLFFNPGGPGESGNEILTVALALVPAAVRHDFDIVSFDPRGTGASSPLRCGTSPSALTSVEPVPSAPGQPLPGTPVFSLMAQACARQSALVPYLDTTSTARDMDRIRAALSLPQISYYGLSYGTVLGTEYARLFPSHVRTMVLDGAVDVNASLTRQAAEAAPAEERSIDHLLRTACPPSGSTCPLGTNPRRTYGNLVASLGRHPLPAPPGDASPVTVGDLDTAALFAVSVPEAAGPFLSAVGAAQHGNGAPLRGLALQFQEDVDGSPLEEALWAITCNDAARHPSPVAAGTQARSLAAREPLLGAYAVTYTMGGCVDWPTARSPVTDVHLRDAPPVLVVGNTGDPNTPYVGARHLASAISSAGLLTWRGFGHTWLLSGSGDSCMQHWVTRYLSGGGLPPGGTVCR